MIPDKTFPPNTPLKAIFEYVKDVALSGDSEAYSEATMEYMEYIGADSYSGFFDELPLALAMQGTMQTCRISGLSYRMCAVIIFGQMVLKVASNRETTKCH